jgi:hypothetical protein
MRRVAAALVAASVAGLLACGGDAPLSAPKDTASSSDADLAGRYGLTTVNSRSLPQVIRYDASGALDALSGFIELKADGHFMDILTLRRRGSAAIEIQIDTLFGTFLRADRTLLFVPDNEDIAPYFFDVHNGKLTAFDAAFTIVYERR